jgi:hypothetical protein
MRGCNRELDRFLMPEILGLLVKAVRVGLQELVQFQGINSAEETGNNDGIVNVSINRH